MPNVQTWLSRSEYKKLEEKAQKLELTVYAYLKLVILKDLQE